MTTFKQAWKKMEALGYQYGKEALEQVRFGWELYEKSRKGTITVKRLKVTSQTPNDWKMCGHCEKELPHFKDNPHHKIGTNVLIGNVIVSIVCEPCARKLVKGG